MVSERKDYQTPELTKLGSVETLTQGPWGGIFDSIFGTADGDGGYNPFTGGGPLSGETS